MSADPFPTLPLPAAANVSIGTSLPQVPGEGGIFFEVDYGTSVFTVYIAPAGGQWKKMTLNQPVLGQGEFGSS